MSAGLATINTIGSDLRSVIGELGLSTRNSQPITFISFLAELIERLRTLDSQLLGLVIGQFTPVNEALSELQITTGCGLRVVGCKLNTFSPELATRNTQPSTQTPMLEPQPNDRRTLHTAPRTYEIQQLVIQTAQRYGVDPTLALAVAKAESNFDPNAISHKGAIGVMQLMPETAKALGVANPYEPTQNIDGGIRYLKQLIERFGGNIVLAVAAYNAGPNAVRRYSGIPPYPETQAFVRRVLAYWEAFRKEVQRTANSEWRMERGIIQETVNQAPIVGESDKPLGESSTFLRSAFKSFERHEISVRSSNEENRQTATRKLQSPFIIAPRYSQHKFTDVFAAKATEHQSQLLASPKEETKSSLTVTAKGGSLQTNNSEEKTDQGNLLGQKTTQTSDFAPRTSHLAPNEVGVSRGSSASSAHQKLLQDTISFPHSEPRAPHPIVHRLTIELPTPDDGERLRLQVSLPLNSFTALRTQHPAPSDAVPVQVSIKVSDEQLATQLAQNLPTLRQHLLEQGIVLAQWTVVFSGQEGGRRDPAEHFGDWRRLPSASHSRLPAHSLEEGIWA